MKIFLSLIFSLFILNDSNYSQDWLPLEIGNHWQFKRSESSGSFPNYTVNYSLYEINISIDTIIQGKKYFKWSPTGYVRYSETEKKAYAWKTNREDIYMDFNKAIGDTFIVSNISYKVIGGQLSNIFGLDLPYLGKRLRTVIPPNYREYVSETTFISSIGWYYFYDRTSGTMSESSDYLELIMAILRDSIQNEIKLTFAYKPQFIFTPIISTNKRLLYLTPTVNHNYDVLPASNSSGFSFISNVLLERFYMKGDSVVAIAPIQVPGNPTSQYIFYNLLDTLLMKNGFNFFYRFTAVDKGIIPETSCSPDSGYYKCVWDFSTDVEVEDEFIVKEFSLSQNYPNPFNPSTKISWQSPVGSHQTLKVYDVLGREVATLVSEYRNAGVYEVEFNAVHLPSGVYFYQLKSGAFVETKKMMVVK